MVVALADHIGARLDQHPDDLQVGGFGGEMQRIGIVAEIADLDVGASLQQQLDAFSPVKPSRQVKGGLLLKISAARIDQLGMGIEQPTQLIDFAVLGGSENRIHRLLLLR